MTDSNIKRIRLSKSCIGQDEKNAVLDVLTREYLGMGEDTRLFEEELRAFFDRPVVCVNTGTSAIQLAIQGAGIGVGDEVLVQSLTFVATPQAISATGARPIPCEVNPSTLTIDLDDADTKISSNTKAIVPVHYSGGVGELEDVYTFAAKHKIRVIEDACHAFGTQYHGRRVGSFGDIACFSFDGIKNITSGEGGCIVTSDTNVLNLVKDLRLLGVEKDTEKRFSGQRSWEFDVHHQGWRYHMSNIMAAIGRVQLKRFDEFRIKRQKLVKIYNELLIGIENIQFLELDYNCVVPHIFVVFVDSDMRDFIREALLIKGIETGIHYKPFHQLSMFNANLLQMPQTDEIAEKMISLPLHPDLNDLDVAFICEELKKLVHNHHPN